MSISNFDVHVGLSVKLYSCNRHTGVVSLKEIMVATAAIFTLQSCIDADSSDCVMVAS